MRPNGVAMRSGQPEGVADRQAHVRQAELGDRRPVGELDHRVDDRLRVHDHLDLVVRRAEQLVGLDHLEALVHQRAGVDGDLRTHLPRRMGQRLVDTDVGQLVGGPAAERPAARREQDAGDLAPGDRRSPAGTGARRCARCRPGPARRRASRAAAARRVRRRSGSPCSPAPAACRARSAAIVTGSPAKPTTALTTTSATSARSASSSTTVANGRAAATSARRAGSPTATKRGRNSAACSTRTSTDEPTPSADDLVAAALGADDVERLGADRAGRAGDGDPHRVYCAQGSSTSVT